MNKTELELLKEQKKELQVELYKTLLLSKELDEKAKESIYLPKKHSGLVSSFVFSYKDLSEENKKKLPNFAPHKNNWEMF